MPNVSREQTSNTASCGSEVEEAVQKSDDRWFKPSRELFYSEKLFSIKGNNTKTDKRLESHPSAEINHPHQAEVMQFSYQNNRVANITSVFSTIHRSTTSASNSRANKRQREQIKVGER